MSTRCQIIIQHFKTIPTKESENETDIDKIKTELKNVKNELVYHHYDGYKMGVGKELMEYIMGIDENNDFNDLKYCESYGLERKLKKEYELEDPKELKDKYDSVLHGDIEYIYLIQIINNNEISLFITKSNYGDEFKEQEKLVQEGIFNGKDLQGNLFSNDNRIIYRDLKNDILRINF